MFTNPTGQPLDPRADNREWAELLKEAAVREARLHDARHTAATVLLVLGISQRAVMGLMGWSTNAMTTHYQHLTPDSDTTSPTKSTGCFGQTVGQMRPPMGNDLVERTLPLVRMVARGGVEPPTFRFSVGRSYQLSYLAVRAEARSDVPVRPRRDSNPRPSP